MERNQGMKMDSPGRRHVGGIKADSGPSQEPTTSRSEMGRCVLSHFSCVCLIVTPGTIARLGSSVHGILQARILEWVAMPFGKWLRGGEFRKGEESKMLASQKPEDVNVAWRTRCLRLALIWTHLLDLHDIWWRYKYQSPPYLLCIWNWTAFARTYSCWIFPLLNI